ncbi:MAG: hypothetical protein UT33_C0009G0014 [Candidatus Peregrinibacteria bacterium GW2011_GWC2_39_14]|nr:MAG: hypothetical protein US92_C0005G0014 [Candidatus Peregrinibacteria bacterium GW2011_GWA2_38_36]KKR06563.1 MAG: hypothetical protein UT33_C0009G0014 [Candidatus Peregrinibacteria bacterium GW2011_GWC2_39_14]
MNKKHVGVILILLASIIWAIDPVLVKLSYSNATFVQTLGIRAIPMVIIAFIYTLITNKASFKVTKKEFSAMMYLAIFGSIIGDLIYFYSVSKISVVNYSVIGHIQPIFILLIGYFFLKSDKITKYDYIGVAFMFLAAFFVVAKDMDSLRNFSIGTKEDYFMLIATIAWATTGMVARKYLSNTNAGVTTFYRFGIGAVMLVAYLIYTNAFYVSNVYQILNGVIAGIGILLFYEAMKRLKAAQVTSLELTSPFFVAILGFIFLGESVTIMQMGGMFLLIFGIYFLSKKESTTS